YLSTYPYACSEQLASRLLALASLRDVLGTLAPNEFPRKAAVDAAIGRDALELENRFDFETGFGLWKKGDGSWPFVSIHALHAFLRAGVGDKRRAQYYLERVPQQLDTVGDDQARAVIRAYALYVHRLVLGANESDRLRATAEKLIQDYDLTSMPAEALAFL